MTVLVTGGAGYIGSHTVRALRDAGREVVVVDTLENGSSEAVLGAPLVVGDVADHDLVTTTCREHGVDAIVHFAAYKAVGESMQRPAKYFRNNVDGTVALLEAARSCSIERFVFSSSCAVHGTPPAIPLREDMPIAPESVYAETKAMCERLLHWYGEVGGLRSVSLRYFNAAGASFDAAIGEHARNSANLVPIAIDALLTGGELDVFGADYPTPDGTCIRDYIHVEDLADAHVRALDYLAGGGATTAINVGTGVGSSVFDVLAAIEQVAGRPVPHRVVGRRPGDPAASFAEPSRAESLLGWSARHGLPEIVETAHRWHLSQLDC